MSLFTYPFTSDFMPIINDTNINSVELGTTNITKYSIEDDGFGNIFAAYPSALSTSSANTTTYFTISFNTNLNYACNIYSLTFYVGKGGASDPRGYKIYSNKDNYVTPLADIQLPTGSFRVPAFTTIDLNIFQITQLTLRIYVYAPTTGNSVDFRFFSINGIVFINPISNICFPAGTPITTDQGNIPIEKIYPTIHTICNKKIVGITKTITQDKYLVCFEKDALGNNIPSQKTIASKNHSIFYKDIMREAKQFLGINNNVYKIKYTGEVLYNVLMEEHDKMIVNNLICETLHPKNGIAKLYRYIQKLNPKEQEALIKKYNELVIKDKIVTSKKIKLVIQN